MPRVVVIHGPNLNLLGTREPEVYGTQTLAEIDAAISRVGQFVKWEVETFQSNHEGELIDRIQSAATADGIIINGGALSHYGLALADALRAVPVPAVEVHLSNIYAREEWRRRSVLSEACVGVIAGLGLNGYIAALHYLAAVHPQQHTDNEEQPG
jgi:3-dehydroquinate dehydratase-2